MKDTYDMQFEAAARLSPSFAFEAKASASGEITGLASTFGGPPDSYGDVIQPGAFADSLAEWTRRKAMPPLLWAHDTGRPVGRWESMSETAEGLTVRGRLNLATEAGRDAWEHARAGDVGGLSIGYAIPEGGARRDGRDRVLTKIDLWEVSLVTIPANREARVSGVKSAEIAKPSDLRAALRAAGFTKSEAERIAAGGWRALAGEEGGAEAAALVQEIRAAAAAFKTE